MSKSTKHLDYLWMIYGDCFCASPEVYNRIALTVKNGIKQLDSIELTETNEIAKVNKVDPLGITDLRVRGMWHIQNPKNIFIDYFNKYSDSKTTIVVLMKKTKFDSFDSKSIIQKNKAINKSEIRIKNPDNPAKKLE